MPPKLFVPNVIQVQNAGKHLRYEWRQLEGCNRIANSFRSPIFSDLIIINSLDDRICYDLALTGFVIHARNLLHFFHSSTIRTEEHDDILADDFYLPPYIWNPPKILGKDAEWRKTIQTKVNKQAAHITNTRGEMEYALAFWDVDGIFEYLSILWNHFNATASRTLFIP